MSPDQGYPQWTPANPPPGYYYNARQNSFLLLPLIPAPNNAGQQRAVNNGAGSSAMVFGILALVIGWIPILGLICALIAIGLGMIGVRNANAGEATNKGAAISGIVMGCINLAVSVGFIILFVTLMNQPH